MSCRGARTCENHRPSWVCGGLVLLHLNAVGCRRERLVVPAGRMYMYRLYVVSLQTPSASQRQSSKGARAAAVGTGAAPGAPANAPTASCGRWYRRSSSRPAERSAFVSTSVTCDVTTDSPSEPSRQRRNDHRANDPSSWHVLMHPREARDRAGV